MRKVWEPTHNGDIVEWNRDWLEWNRNFVYNINLTLHARTSALNVLCCSLLSEHTMSASDPVCNGLSKIVYRVCVNTQGHTHTVREETFAQTPTVSYRLHRAPHTHTTLCITSPSS